LSDLRQENGAVRAHLRPKAAQHSAVSRDSVWKKEAQQQGGSTINGRIHERHRLG